LQNEPRSADRAGHWC